MERRFAVTCDPETAERIEVLARRYGASEREVVRQLLEVGLEEMED